MMNMKNTVVAASLLSLVSFGAFAATAVNADQAQNLQSMGTVSVSGIGSSPMDMHQKLEQKAQDQGASSYRIIEARSGDQWHATAELYK